MFVLKSIDPPQTPLPPPHFPLCIYYIRPIPTTTFDPDQQTPVGAVLLLKTAQGFTKYINFSLGSNERSLLETIVYQGQ